MDLQARIMWHLLKREVENNFLVECGNASNQFGEKDGYQHELALARREAYFHVLDIMRRIEEGEGFEEPPVTA